jgi:hypothetical protein
MSVVPLLVVSRLFPSGAEPDPLVIRKAYAGDLQSLASLSSGIRISNNIETAALRTALRQLQEAAKTNERSNKCLKSQP